MGHSRTRFDSCHWLCFMTFSICQIDTYMLIVIGQCKNNSKWNFRIHLFLTYSLTYFLTKFLLFYNIFTINKYLNERLFWKILTYSINKFIVKSATYRNYQDMRNFWKHGNYLEFFLVHSKYAIAALRLDCDLVQDLRMKSTEQTSIPLHLLGGYCQQQWVSVTQLLRNKLFD